MYKRQGVAVEEQATTLLDAARTAFMQGDYNSALASRADNNDTIDLAVLGGLKNAQELNGYQVVHFQPFDPVHKRTEAAVKAADGRTFKVTKGAPQVILELSANAGQVKPTVEKAVNEFAARGFRSLGVARAEGEGQWQFLGVLPLFDPPREDAKATIATACQMLSLIHIYAHSKSIRPLPASILGSVRAVW